MYPYIKFWDEAEYLSYNAILGKPVIMLQNVYPFAHYLLAIIQIERGLFEKALSTLNKGLGLSLIIQTY